LIVVDAAVQLHLRLVNIKCVSVMPKVKCETEIIILLLQSAYSTCKGKHLPEAESACLYQCCPILWFCISFSVTTSGMCTIVHGIVTENEQVSGSEFASPQFWWVAFMM